MDLSQYDTAKDEGAVMQLRHPGTDQPLLDGEAPITITLISRDSNQFQSLQRKVTNRRLQRAGKAGKLKVSIEEIEEDSIDLLVAATKGWQGIEFKGSVLPYSPENARVLYEALPWVKEQVDAFINDRSNFLGNSSKAS